MTILGRISKFKLSDNAKAGLCWLESDQSFNMSLKDSMRYFRSEFGIEVELELSKAFDFKFEE